VLRLVLSYSRKGYSEAVTRQDTETFLRCLENALRSFGGAPLLLKHDFVPRNKIVLGLNRFAVARSATCRG
jgi:transposase